MSTSFPRMLSFHHFKLPLDGKSSPVNARNTVMALRITLHTNLISQLAYLFLSPFYFCGFWSPQSCPALPSESTALGESSLSQAAPKLILSSFPYKDPSARVVSTFVLHFNPVKLITDYSSAMHNPQNAICVSFPFTMPFPLHQTSLSAPNHHINNPPAPLNSSTVKFLFENTAHQKRR